MRLLRAWRLTATFTCRWISPRYGPRRNARVPYFLISHVGRLTWDLDLPFSDPRETTVTSVSPPEIAVSDPSLLTLTLAKDRATHARPLRPSKVALLNAQTVGVSVEIAHCLVDGIDPGGRALLASSARRGVYFPRGWVRLLELAGKGRSLSRA